jgi:hypothetical protein
MDPQVFATIIAGIFLLTSVIVSIVTAFLAKKTSDTIKHHGVALAKKFDETAKVNFIDGERECFDALTRLTLQEKLRTRVTRFNPRKIQRQKKYYEAMVARILGTPYEDETYGRIEKYYRLTALNSAENKSSLVEMCKFFLEKECTNLILRITVDKNDFELVIFDQLKTAVFCFHDFNKHDVLHSCLITRDEGLYVYFEQLYEKLWREDIILEIDFSIGRKLVEEKISILESMPIYPNKEILSPLEGTKVEAQFKIDICNFLFKTINATENNLLLNK